jgi:hypothetical protein
LGDDRIEAILAGAPQVRERYVDDDTLAGRDH